jgi:hypothetical protein
MIMNDASARHNACAPVAPVEETGMSRVINNNALKLNQHGLYLVTVIGSRITYDTEQSSDLYQSCIPEKANNKNEITHTEKKTFAEIFRYGQANVNTHNYFADLINSSRPSPPLLTINANCYIEFSNIFTDLFFLTYYPRNTSFYSSHFVPNYYRWNKYW